MTGRLSDELPRSDARRIGRHRARALMCVVALAHRAHPDWRLVVAANRDEFHARPSAPLDRWTDADDVLAGRDLLSGGSWIGVSEAGRFAVVTNVAGHPRGGGAPSRGALVADYLRCGALPDDDGLDAYGGFSLITIGPVADYRTNQPRPLRHILSSGVHGISNGPLDPPSLRTRAVTMALDTWLSAPQPVGHLLDLLVDETPAPEGERPVFIRDAVYGTRCSTVIAIDHAGDGIIVEQRFHPDGTADGVTRLAFRWPTN
nr:NRDE family protein [uncultured Sphingomonas sp.]